MSREKKSKQLENTNNNKNIASPHNVCMYVFQDVYYAGETISGSVLLENTENIKIRGIRVLLRGKVHATLKVVKSGERRTLKDDQYVLDEKQLLWGKGE